MVYLLTAFGHEILQAHDGEQGIALAQRERPELILLDIHMPRMDGYEVVRHVRAAPPLGQIPVVAVTALAMVGDREKILASGFTDYIAKPIDPEAFPAQVQGFLGRQVPAGGQPPVPSAAVQPEKHPAPVTGKVALVFFVDNTQNTNEHRRCAGHARALRL